MFNEKEKLDAFLKEIEPDLMEICRKSGKLISGENACIWLSKNSIELSTSLPGNDQGYKRKYEVESNGKMYSTEVISYKTEV